MLSKLATTVPTRVRKFEVGEALALLDALGSSADDVTILSNPKGASLEDWDIDRKTLTSLDSYFDTHMSASKILLYFWGKPTPRKSSRYLKGTLQDMVLERLRY